MRVEQQFFFLGLHLNVVIELTNLASYLYSTLEEDRNHWYRPIRIQNKALKITESDTRTPGHVTICIIYIND